MLGIIPGLVWPQLRVEIEVTAVRPPAERRPGRAGG